MAGVFFDFTKGEEQMNEDIKEFLTLAKIVLEKKLEAQVGAKLGIKGASVRRELNRIIAFYCEPESTKQKEAVERNGRFISALCVK